MSDYLSKLVTRTLGTALIVRPRLPSLFETTPTILGPSTELRATDRSTTEPREPTHNFATAPIARELFQQQWFVMDKNESNEPRPQVRAEPNPRSDEKPEMSGRQSMRAAAEPQSPRLKQTPPPDSPANKVIKATETKKSVSEIIAEPTKSVQKSSGKIAPRVRADVRQVRDEGFPEVRFPAPDKTQPRKAEPESRIAAIAVPISSERVERPIITASPHLIFEPIATSQPPPEINVTIGRVDVRAVFSQSAQLPQPSRQPSRPSALDEYLNRRSTGQR